MNLVFWNAVYKISNNTVMSLVCWKTDIFIASIPDIPKPCTNPSIQFLPTCSKRGGRVLIYCPGVSRSGAIAISYLINNGMNLLAATRLVKEKRRVVLTNWAFMRQLIEYARGTGHLEKDVKGIRTQNYFSPLNHYRIKSSHLPSYWEL